MPSEENDIGFTPVTHDHFVHLSRWLNAPHMREWWGEPEEELGHIRDMVDGRDSTRPFLITLGNRPIGYIQYWFIGHHQNEVWIRDHPWLAELPSETIGLDLSIGEPDLLSKGIGSRALRAFAQDRVAEGHATIIIDPDENNARAVRAYTKAGFFPVPYLAGRTGDTLIMQYATNANETS